MTPHCRACGYPMNLVQVEEFSLIYECPRDGEVVEKSGVEYPGQ